MTTPPAKARLRLFWKAAKTARHRADDVELRCQFLQRARTSGLIAAVHAASHHGQADVEHVLDWALRGWDPWGSAEFRN